MRVYERVCVRASERERERERERVCVFFEPYRLYIVQSSRPLSHDYISFSSVGVRVAHIAATCSAMIGCGWPCSMFACVFIDIDITRCEKLSTRN